jgi:uncharacterized protein
MANDDNIRGFSRLAAPVQKAGGSRAIDLWRLAAEQRAIELKVNAADLTRLRDALVLGDSCLLARIAGLEVEGKPSLRVSVQGELSVMCQRCLGPMPWIVEVDSVLLLKRTSSPESDAAEVEWTLDDLQDVVVVGADVTPESLIEDELLLSLPLAPMHESCSAPLPEHYDASSSPFAVLRKKFGKHSKE